MAIFQPRNVTEDVLTYFDILFMHRPISNTETSLLWTANRLGVKTWIDIDDLLWDIPLTNPALIMHGPKERENLMTSFLNADVITCSTPYLAERIEKDFGRRAIAIPNAWNERTGKPTAFNAKPEKKAVLYRGSNTHDAICLPIGRRFRKSRCVQLHGFAPLVLRQGIRRYASYYPA